MIYTLTCNPALDCTVRLGALQQGVINFVDGCDLTPGGIIRKLDLRRPIYAPTAALGHFGVEGRPWEATDIADELKKLAGI